MPFVFNPVTGKLDFVNPPTTDASLLTSGTLADARLSSNVSLNNINNSFTSGQTITSPENTSALTASYSVTGANTTPLLNLSGTWNTTGVARGILLNITDTASAANSSLIDLRRSGSSVFTVSKFGSLSCFQLTTNLSSISCGSINMAAVNTINWSFDTYIQRDGAANTLALRNGTAAQTFRLYTTFTDASNYERGFMRWNSNVLEIGTEAGGTGAARSIRIAVGSNNATFSQSGSGLRLSVRDLSVGSGVNGSGVSLVQNPSVGWSSRNSDNTAFRAIQGQITTDTAYTATPITPTGFLTIYDSTGTAYKVACSL